MIVICSYNVCLGPSTPADPEPDPQPAPHPLPGAQNTGDTGGTGDTGDTSK